MTMESLEETLQKNRVEIVTKLQIDRAILFAYLRSKSVLDREDCELIESEKTRERRASSFLDILSLKGKEALSHFIDVLQLLNPELYQKVTGQKATARTNPIATNLEQIFSEEKERLQPFDLDVLSSHLRRLATDHQELAVQLEHVLREKACLQEQRDKSTEKCKEKENRIRTLEQQLCDAEACAVEARDMAMKEIHIVLQKNHHAEWDRAQTDSYIMQLQMKLLTANEEIRNQAKKLETAEAKNDELQDSVEDLRRHHDLEKQNSIKLSEELQTQNGKIREVEEMVRKNRELQFKVNKVTCDRDDAQKELRELKKWTEALKARFDMVNDAKVSSIENQGQLQNSFSKLRNEMFKIEKQLIEVKREKEVLQQNCKQLEHTANSHRKQKKLLQDQLSQEMMTRNRIQTEKDELERCYNSTVEANEQTIKKQTELLNQNEERCHDLQIQLRTTQEKLVKEERERVETLVQLNEIKLSELNTATDLPNGPCAGCIQYKEDLHEAYKNTCLQLKIDTSEEAADPSTKCKSLSKERPTEVLLRSIYRRFNNSRKQSSTAPVRSRRQPEVRRSRSLDSELSAIFPEFQRLPPEIRSQISLDANSADHILPFEMLAQMFPSVGHNPGNPYTHARHDGLALWRSPFEGSDSSSSDNSEYETYEPNGVLTENRQRKRPTNKPNRERNKAAHRPRSGQAVRKGDKPTSTLERKPRSDTDTTEFSQQCTGHKKQQSFTMKRKIPLVFEQFINSKNN